MKQMIIAGLIILMVSCNDNDQQTFTVEGNIKGGNVSMIYLEENPVMSQSMTVDSAEVVDGSFSLTTVVNDESIYSLRTKEQAYPFALLINDSRKVNVEADLMNEQIPYTVRGSKASEALIEFDRKVDESLKQHLKSMREIDSLGKISPVAAVDKMRVDSIINMRFASYEANADELKDYARQFILNSESPVLALYAFGSFQTRASQFGMKSFSQPETIDIISQTAARFPNNTAIQEQKQKLKPAIAPDFNMADTTGNPVSLASFRGKWVLVDFWASWCIPCRKENPNVLEAFRKFRNRNFTILGVSLDDNRNAWLQAIQQDALTWTHVSDLRGWNNEAVKLYQVRSIPHNILIDPNGNIVAEKLMGEDLHSTLARYVK